MPLYQYRCHQCGQTAEVFRSVYLRDAGPPCHTCSAGDMFRQPASPTVIWKDHKPGQVTAAEVMNGADPVSPSRAAE